MKKRATEQPEAPPSVLLRELSEAPSEVLSQLPDRQQLRKMVVRERGKDLPLNPMNLEELEEIPVQFNLQLAVFTITFTLTIIHIDYNYNYINYLHAGEKFLLYDSYNEEEETEGRVIVFATAENIVKLMKCQTWYLDVIF